MGKVLRLRDGLDEPTKHQWGALLRAIQEGTEGKEKPIVANYCLQRALHEPAPTWTPEWTRLLEDEYDHSAGDPVLTFYGVTEGTKRDGSKVRVGGIKIDGLRKNPVFARFHQYDEMPIGRIVGVRNDGKTPEGHRAYMIRVARLATPTRREDGSLRAKVQDANDIMDAYQYGDMHAVSFGWRALKVDPILDDEGRVTGFDFLESDALEWSAVTVPADADAVQARCQRGQLRSEALATGKPHAVYIMREEVAVPPAPADAAASRTGANSVLAGWIPEVAAEPDTTAWYQGRAWDERTFDAADAVLHPANIAIDLASKFLGVPVREMHQGGTCVSPFRMGAFLLALDQQLAGWVVDDMRRIVGRDGAEAPCMYETIQLNSKRRQDFLVSGTRYLSNPETGQRLVVDVDVSWWGLDVTTYATIESGLGRELVDNTWTRAQALKLLKGEAFTLSGQFITREDQTGFDELFLEPAQEAAIKRAATAITKDGAAMRKRGIFCFGPPGTGKTTALRALLHETSGDEPVTFVWVSARDFYRLGGIGGFKQAFDVARENAPCILGIEDCDNWIDDEGKVDLLKTEMDGVDLHQNDGILTVLTSNHPERMPPAITDRPGRFDDLLKFDLPSAGVRTRMLAAWMPALDAEQLTVAVQATEGYSGAHLRELVYFATALQDEEELDPAAALQRALDKLAEQKEVIAEARRRSCTYEPTPEIIELVRTAEGYWQRKRGMHLLRKISTDVRIGKKIAQRNKTRLEDVAQSIMGVAGMFTQAADQLTQAAQVVRQVLNEDDSTQDPSTAESEPVGVIATAILEKSAGIVAGAGAGAADLLRQVNEHLYSEDDEAGMLAAIAAKTGAAAQRDGSDDDDETNDDPEEPMGGPRDDFYIGDFATRTGALARTSPNGKR